jgi:hypothetical protein
MLLLALLFAVLTADCKPNRGASNALLKEYTDHENRCVLEQCFHLDFDYRSPCVKACMSPTCNRDVYGTDPLEPGEVDQERSRRFRTCFHRERREVAGKEREARAGAGREIDPAEAEMIGEAAEEEAQSNIETDEQEMQMPPVPVMRPHNF